VTYNHLLGRNPYISKRLKKTAAPFSTCPSAFVERIGMDKTVLDSGLLNSEIVGVCPYQKGLTYVLILLSNGSYSSIMQPRVSV